jgi:hypothetical protein
MFPIDVTPGGTPAPQFARDGASGAFPPGSPGNARFPLAAADGVRPAWFGGASATGGDGASGGRFGGMFAGFARQLQSFFGRSPASATPFRNVSVASTGDPHLSVLGTTRGGPEANAQVDRRYDSMTGHADLFSSNDFGNGFTVSTTVTAPGAGGITQSASATATMDGGGDSVTLTNAGAVSVVSGGSAIPLAPGQTIALAGGASVSESASGAVTIGEQGYGGAELTTTFALNATGGVDVTAHGRDVTLSGDLIAGV